MSKVHHPPLASTVRKRMVVLGLCSFLIGLSIAWGLINISVRNNFELLDVVFVDANQVLLFWKTTKPSLGYIQYGPSPLIRPNVVEQSSSDVDQAHAVVITDVPLDGIYVSFHQKGESPLLLPIIKHITYDEYHQ